MCHATDTHVEYCINKWYVFDIWKCFNATNGNVRAPPFLEITSPFERLVKRIVNRLQRGIRRQAILVCFIPKEADFSLLFLDLLPYLKLRPSNSNVNQAVY